MAKQQSTKSRKKAVHAEPKNPGQATVDEVRSIGVEEFTRRLRTDAGTERRFALFLGAGCSVTSGIPAAAGLVRDRWLPRLRDFKAPERTDLEAWAMESIPGYEPPNPGSSYGALIDRLFLTAEERQREIENLCDGRTPSFGYAVLAQLIAQPEGRFNVVLTTNFDDLVSDALYLYTEARPLVISHESLAAFIRPTRTRPLVVKLHGDHRLSPRNTSLETADLEVGFRRHTSMVLHDRGLIFMGYGGADAGILKMLNELPPEALPFGAYWVHPEEPRGEVLEWLKKRRGVWVRSGWFDEVMLLILNEFSLPHPVADRFIKVFDEYHSRFLEVSKSIKNKPLDESGVQALRKAVQETGDQFTDYWKVIFEADRLERLDQDAADVLYQQGLEQFPNAIPVLGNYAIFLENIRKDYDRAEELYQRALEADPTHTTNLGNYALFLKTIRKDYERAEELYRRALEADPTHANNLGGYAMFLDDIRKDYNAAEELYRRALEAEPTHANNLGNYAIFLQSIRKDYDRTEELYRRALEADPTHANNLGNYALFLKNIRKDYDKAEELYRRALEVDPTHANNLGNYAIFLDDIRKDYDTAEELYRRALEADQTHANNLGNYAIFLQNIRKDYDMAELLYRRVLEADPTHAGTLGNYAMFLQSIRKDYDRAEELYRRALEVDPTHENNLGNYAIFLQDIREDYIRAEELYNKVRAINPTDVNIAANIAGLLLALGRADGPEKLTEAVMLLDSSDNPVVELECSFYRYMHGPVADRPKALRDIRDLIDKGVRSPGWDLSRNVERAIQDGHSEAPWLGKLAAVINGDAAEEILADWQAWNTES